MSNLSDGSGAGFRNQALRFRKVLKAKEGGQSVEDLLVAVVAVALMVYLFVVLLKPEKF